MKNSHGKKKGFKIKPYSLLLSWIALFVVFLFTCDAYAVQIKRVQTGEIYFDADDITQVAEVESVDPSKTLVLLYVNADSTTTNNYAQCTLFTADFGSNTELVISRDGSSFGVTVRYYLIEFADGVKVLRGITSFAAGSYTNPKYTTKTISLSPSLDDYTKAFPVVQVRAGINNSATEEITTVMGTVVNNNTLQLERYATNDILRSVNIVYQVVQFSSDANIKTGTVTLAVNQGSNTGTWTGAVDLAKSFLVFSAKANRSTNGIEGYFWIRGEITNGTTVTFTRGYQSTTTLTDVLIRYYVVELTDPVSIVQGQSVGAVTVPTGASSAEMNLATAVDPTRSAPFFSVSGPQGNSGTTYNEELNFSIERDSPRGIVYDPGNNYVWVTNYHSNTVTRYNASTGALIGSPISVGTNPIAIAYCSNTSPPSIWVANYGSNNVTRIRADTGAVEATINVGLGPIDIAVDTASSPVSVWTANNGQTTEANNVTKINTSTNGATSYAGYNGTNEGRPTSICFDPGSGGSAAYMWIGYA
ncbi:MAG: hypothetical protein NC916_01515, partial [Candidatus Omnitrophica bacterium]|nr:hypothetical protein [Candidatus Omnitrophota bacterium]